MSASTHSPSSQSAPTPFDSIATVAARARKVFDENNAVQLATLGGAWSPWILGAYFARAPEVLWLPDAKPGLGDLDLVLMVERNGKTMSNLQVDPRVAFSVSKNDATLDFIQGSGDATVLTPGDEPHVMDALTRKMSWYRLYTPCLPVRITVNELFVTSFELGWMPALRLTLR